MLLEPEKRRSKKAKKSAITRSSHTESQQLPITTYSILIKMEGDRFFFFVDGIVLIFNYVYFVLTLK